MAWPPQGSVGKPRKQGARPRSQGLKPGLLCHPPQQREQGCCSLRDAKGRGRAPSEESGALGPRPGTATCHLLHDLEQLLPSVSSSIVQEPEPDCPGPAQYLLSVASYIEVTSLKASHGPQHRPSTSPETGRPLKTKPSSQQAAGPPLTWGSRHCPQLGLPRNSALAGYLALPERKRLNPQTVERSSALHMSDNEALSRF